MDVMVVGGGGREHALISSLKLNPEISTIYALPGNGGIAAEARCVPISATDIPALVDFAVSNDIDFAVVAPDDPLVLGAVDALEAAGIPCFGPDSKAALIEGSKSFAKQLMRDANIPTADYRVFEDEAAAVDYLQGHSYPVVIKADGLALGKGVIIAEDLGTARDAVHSMMAESAFGDAGKQVVIEEFLTGPEVTVLAFTDGTTVVPMISSMDHKRAHDGDLGPNTGGMGVIAPNPYYTQEIAEQCRLEIFEPTIAALRERGRPFKGCLYFGLMLTPQGPKVIEYNCRFGDPEAQAVLPLLETDLLTIMRAVRDERLSEVDVRFSKDSSCCVVVASGGYPGVYEKGLPIAIAEASADEDNSRIFHAGTALVDDRLVTVGGRVLAVTATGPDLPAAIERAYAATDRVSFLGAFHRGDIGASALRGLAADDSSLRRVFVEKKPDYAAEADSLLADARELLGIRGLESVRIIQRYDIAGLPADLEGQARSTVLSEPPVDNTYDELPTGADAAFAVEYLPGQFDQRADSAAQCLQLLSQGERPIVMSAQIYLLGGDLSADEVEAVKRYLINPVDSREIPVDAPPAMPAAAAAPQAVPTLDGFINLDDHGLRELAGKQGLAMDHADLKFCQEYFQGERRDPSLTELKVIDTYWSDHCRHTTFLTELTGITFHGDADSPAAETYRRYLDLRDELGRTKPVTLMDLGTIAAKYLRSTGELDRLDESEEINACTVKIDVEIDGKSEPWLLLFKNETHNHPTEIEPFGGAATCIGGAIRDPLSGRAYVYQAMRVTGAGDPRVPLSHTLPGKLSQRQIVTEAAAGYSSYGNQIGLATGLVNEIYHPGYLAKRMEIGAVVGAAPARNVRREEPADGDVIVLLGGKTGRDGCGGATGSSKTHTAESIVESGAEVQKGNAPEERKLQRLFRDPRAARLIKRCNDFGAGGVSVAIGELAPGLRIDLDAVPKKYEGLSGTELAISESQERMAVVLAPEDAVEFMRLADTENLEATVVATVTAEPRLVMNHSGRTIVDLSREFLDSNGASRTAEAAAPEPVEAHFPFAMGESLHEAVLDLASDLNVASQRGLIERFDATIGTGSVLMPLGGARQLTPAQAMAAKLPVLDGETQTSSVMAYGFNPLISEADPYAGAYLAVVESLAKLVAAGADREQTYLTFQEYFPRLHQDPERWGQPLSALLGALRAQLDFKVAAIGGKDSMSGSFEDLDVPPTLVSFAITVAEAGQIISPEFKRTGSRVALVSPEMGADGLPTAESLQAIWDATTTAIRRGEVVSAWTPGYGGVVEGLLKMALGNRIGVWLDALPTFEYAYGAVIIETDLDSTLGETLGMTINEYALATEHEVVDLAEVESVWSGVLEDIFPTRTADRAQQDAPTLTSPVPRLASPGLHLTKPRFLIPVFPGTNCEYDSARAVEAAGGQADVFVIRNLTPQAVAESSREFAKRMADSQVLFLPGGFSGGDEPDGSAKFITSFLRGPQIAEQVMALLDDRQGLALGICNGFQALIKLGLAPYGRIVDPTEDSPTLTFNRISRHQSRLVRTRVSSVRSPWLAEAEVGQIATVAISHGEGRLAADDATLLALSEAGQIATQYVDAEDSASMDIDFNPNGSAWAIEGLTSPDGRVFGKMAHSERIGKNLYRNVPGDFDLGMFTSAVSYFQ